MEYFVLNKNIIFQSKTNKGYIITVTGDEIPAGNAATRFTVTYSKRRIPANEHAFSDLIYFLFFSTHNITLSLTGNISFSGSLHFV